MGRRTIVALLAVLSVSACASPKYNYSPETTEVSSPPLGSTTTVGVGEIMLRQGFFVERESIYLSTPVTVGLLGSYTFSVGSVRTNRASTTCLREVPKAAQ